MGRSLLALSVIGAAALAGCGSSSSSSSAGSAGAGSTASSGLKLAAVVPNTSDPFFQSQVCGMQAQAKKLGVTLKMFTSPSTDTNAIANNFQSAQLTKPQGMIVTPFNNNQFLAQYKTQMSQGVPIVTNNGTKPSAEYKYIHTAGDTARFAPNVLKGVPAGSGSMVYLGGAPGIPPLESRTLPFVKAVKDARSDLKALATEYSGFDPNKASTDVKSLLLAHPDLKLIIAGDGPDALGAASALKAAGKTGKVTLVGFDAIPNELAALKDGTIQYLIAQAPLKLGRMQVDALVDYLKTHKDGGAVSNAGDDAVPNGLLTKDTLNDPVNADFVYKAAC
jgi:ribose transport system substrate-binding protein